jgi:hypothetical protein
MKRTIVLLLAVAPGLAANAFSRSPKTLCRQGRMYGRVEEVANAEAGMTFTEQP